MLDVRIFGNPPTTDEDGDWKMRPDLLCSSGQHTQKVWRKTKLRIGWLVFGVKEVAPPLPVPENPEWTPDPGAEQTPS